MKHFDLFSGYGGFSLALERAYENTRLERERISNNSVSGGQETVNSSRVDSEQTEQSSDNSTELRSRPETIGFSEIDKYASAVLKYHWPKIKNYGDITKINWSEVPDFNLLTGGSPCQNLSIAGKRAGLGGNRSGLFYEFIRAVKEKKPKYFIWENVKGALSSNNGRDFAIVLNEMAEAGYSLWWQVLNAKDFGVPQNRERIFVVGFRDGSPREVFFERGSGGKNIVENDTGQIYKQTRKLSDAFRIRSTDGVSATLKGFGGGMGAKTGLYAITRGRSTEDWKVGTVAPSRRLSDKDDIRVMVPEATKQGYAMAEEGDSINLSVINSTTRRGRVGKGIAQTLDTGMQQHTISDSRIRRLVPVECERLMGLPDGWTTYGASNDIIPAIMDISDSQRYKMCGNGVVVNVVQKLIE